MRSNVAAVLFLPLGFNSPSDDIQNGTHMYDYHIIIVPEKPLYWVQNYAILYCNSACYPVRICTARLCIQSCWLLWIVVTGWSVVAMVRLSRPETPVSNMSTHLLHAPMLEIWDISKPQVHMI